METTRIQGLRHLPAMPAYNRPKPINSPFAKENISFNECCEKAEVSPTTRQASKFRNKKGSAFKMLKKGK